MGLTVVTLVFGELIPKSLGVSNAEMVARIMVRFAVCICLSTCLCMRVHICMPHNAPHPPFPTFTRPHSTTTYPHTPTNKPKINTRCRPSTSWPWCSPPWGRFCPCSPSSSSASSGSRSVNFRSYLYTYTMPSSTPTPPTHPQPPQHPPMYTQADDDERVSEDQLRLLVAGAQKSGGIEAQEGQMINQVLNMQVRF